MTECEQTKGQSVLDHLRYGTDLKYECILPSWVKENKDLILTSLPDDDTLKLYTVFHDCGKPFCLTIDDDGKRHFLNHAEVSYKYFNQVFDNDIAADLILHDMDIHLLKSDGVEEFSKNPYALTLLLTGLAELHSNANMFGGISSTSFKIKFKNISKRGNQIINLIKK